MCDVVHALVVDRIVAEVRIEQQAALLASMMGGKPDWPSVDERVAEFEAALAAEPQRMDPHDADLRRALGLKVG